MVEFAKKFIRRWFRNFIALLGFVYFYPGFQNLGSWQALLTGGFLLTLIQVFLNPFLKVIFLPFNIITLGMFKWLMEATHLVIVAYFLDSLRFVPFSYNSFMAMGILIPGGALNLMFSIIVGSILFKFLRTLVKLLT